MKYKLSKTSCNNVFLINHSQLEGRLDPNTYHNDRLSAIDKLVKSKSPLKRLKYISSFNKSIVTEIIGDSIYVGLENIRSNTGEYNPTTEKESISSAILFKKGDVLFPKLRPNLNKVYYAEFDGLCSTEFHILNSDEVDNKYLTYFLRSSLLINQTKRLMSGNTLPRLQTSDIYNLLIPIKSPETEKKIISIMDDAYGKKKQKEQKARELLDSIDEYLLNELGIKIPTKDNSLPNRIFTTTFKKVSGSRIDPDYYQKFYQNLINTINESKYDKTEIKNISFLVESGKTPAADDYTDTETEYPIIKVGSYSNEFIDLSKVSYTNNQNNFVIRKGDIFILSAAHQSQYVGKFIKYLDEKPLKSTSYVGELICIRTNPLKCNSMYLFSLLNTDIYKILLNREKRGQTSHIYSKDIKNIKVPIPEMKKQEKMETIISNKRNDVKVLLKEANEELEKARQEVEKIILEEE